MSNISLQSTTRLNATVGDFCVVRIGGCGGRAFKRLKRRMVLVRWVRERSTGGCRGAILNILQLRDHRDCGKNTSKPVYSSCGNSTCSHRSDGGATVPRDETESRLIDTRKGWA
jgi:hypothetical protein